MEQAESRMPEINVPNATEALRLPDGRVVLRTTYTTTTVKDVLVFPGDYPNARAVKA